MIASTSYKVEDFLAAANRLGVAVTVASDYEQTFASKTPESVVEVDFADTATSVQRILGFHQSFPLDAIVAAEDDGAVLAAVAAEALELLHNAPEAVVAARRKDITRARLAASHLLCPEFHTLSSEADPVELAGRVSYPCVIKPVSLAASRGVIRADTPDEFVNAFRRVARIVSAADEAWTAPGASGRILVEEYIPGAEVAVEGFLKKGRLYPLAILDKPDPLEGPFFEETLFVTPSRHSQAVQADILSCAAATAELLGLREGPVHAELRINGAGVWMLEMAPRSIGGLCSRIFRFRAGMSLEELILRGAFGVEDRFLERHTEPAGVMMIPIPMAGTLLEVSGLEAAREVEGVEEVIIRMPVGGKLVPPPEGSSYLGFIFARGEDPAKVERTLRAAHTRLAFTIDGCASAAASEGESMLDEQVFNLEIRKLLKRFGVSAQREVEKAVRSQIESGDLSGDEALRASVTLAIDDLDLSFSIEDTIALS